MCPCSTAAESSCVGAGSGAAEDQRPSGCGREALTTTRQEVVGMRFRRDSLSRLDGPGAIPPQEGSDIRRLPSQACGPRLRVYLRLERGGRVTVEHSERDREGGRLEGREQLRQHAVRLVVDQEVLGGRAALR